jgi:hypothetical protein
MRVGGRVVCPAKSSRVRLWASICALFVPAFRRGVGAGVPERRGFLLPTDTTIRRTLGRLDAHALAAAVGDWLVARDRHNHRRALEAGFAACLPGAAWMTPE